MTPHPQRCETCKHKLPDCDKEALGSRVCKKIFLEDPKALQIGIPYFIDIVGCASHSSRPHTPAALATDFDCDNTICLDYKSKCGGCIPERCNYQFRRGRGSKSSEWWILVGHLKKRENKYNR